MPCVMKGRLRKRWSPYSMFHEQKWTIMQVNLSLDRTGRYVRQLAFLGHTVVTNDFQISHWLIKIKFIPCSCCILAAMVLGWMWLWAISLLFYSIKQEQTPVRHSWGEEMDVTAEPGRFPAGLQIWHYSLPFDVLWTKGGSVETLRGGEE